MREHGRDAAQKPRPELAISAARMAVWDRDLVTGQVAWSDQHFLMLGYEVGEVAPSREAWADRVHPDDLPAVEATVRRTIEEGNTFDTEYRVVHPGGTTLWIEARGELVRNEHGNATRLYGVMIDITHLKKQEQVLAETEERMSLAVRATREAIWDCDLVRGTVWWNDAYDELFGERPPETANAWQWWIDHIHSDDQQRVLDTFTGALDGDGDRWSADYRYRRTDDSYAHVSDRAYIARDKTGRATRILGAMRDESEFRLPAAKVLSRLESLVATSSTAIVGLQLDGTIEHWNTRAERLFGYVAEEVIGQPVSLLFPPGLTEDFEGNLKQLKTQDSPLEIETVRLNRDRQPIDVALTVSLVRDESGEPIGLSGIVRSIGDRKRLEQQLAELADRERQEFARDLHDTVGQQLTSLSLHMAALRQKFDNPAQAVDSSELEHIETALQELRQQVRSTYRGLVPVNLDADGLRVALTVLAEEITQRHDVACHLDCPESIELQDNFVATQLYLIAREAVHNAIKHGSPTKVQITVSGIEGLQLSVTDNGSGLTDADIESSDGMGLQIMRYRSNMIGADIRIESGSDGSGVRITCSMRTVES